MIEYHTYLARDVRAWLYEGVENGLSEAVITKIRANALLHNPYVKEDTLLVVSATDEDKVIGYTAMFPDRLVQPEVMLSVATTLWVDPDYAGEFVSMYLTKMLMENPIGNLVGTDAAPASVLVDKLLGLKADMFVKKRFVLNRSVHVHSFRSLGSLILEPWRQFHRAGCVKRMLANIPKDWKLEYMDFVDKEAYDFILSHNDTDMLTRTQDMLNWVIRNPFRVEAPIESQYHRQYYFSSYKTHFTTYLVKCYRVDNMVGLYMLAERGDNTVVLLLYYENDNRECVYSSLLQHVLLGHPQQFWSQYMDLNLYIDKIGIAFHGYEEKFSFTRPKELQVDVNKQLQGVDGDMFV